MFKNYIFLIINKIKNLLENFYIFSDCYCFSKAILLYENEKTNIYILKFTKEGLFHNIRQH